MLLPAVAAFMLVPDWRLALAAPPYPWLAALIAIVVFSPVLIWNCQHDWASFRFQSVRATAPMNCRCARSAIIIGLQLGLVGFVLLPVVLSGVVLTAWRGYRAREPVAILLSTAVLVPFLYFFWKSLTLRVGDTWPMFMWPIGFAAAAINIAMLPREGWPAWMIRSTIDVGQRRDRHPASQWSCWCSSTMSPRPGISSAVPIRSAARPAIEQVVARVEARTAEDRRDLDRDHGLSHLCDAALVPEGSRAGHRDQRARPLPGLCAIPA